MIMSIKNFKTSMEEEKKNERTIHDYISRIEKFSEYLNEKKKKNIEKVQKQDLTDFFKELKETESTPVLNRFSFALSNYFKFAKNEKMYNAANEMNGQLSIEQLKIKEFLGINKEDINKLSKLGVKTAQQMIEKGKTVKSRKELSEESGLSEGTILEILKLSNLARIGGLNGIKTRYN